MKQKEIREGLVIPVFKKIIGFIKLVRPVNLVIIVISFLIGFLFMGNCTSLILPLLYVLIAAMGYIINDIKDYNIDMVNKPERPLPSNVITKKEAKIFFFVILVVFVFLNFKFKPVLLIFNDTVLILVVLYSIYFKRKGFIGNLLVAFFTVTPFISIIISLGFNSIIFPLIFFAFFINLLREIVKDLDDFKGDKLIKSKSLPLKYGYKFTYNTLIILTCLFFASTLYFENNFGKNIYYLIFVIIIVNGLNCLSLFFTKKKEYNISSILYKISILFGIGGLWLSK